MKIKKKCPGKAQLKKLFLAILSQARTIKLRLNDNACWCFFVGFCDRNFFERRLLQRVGVQRTKTMELVFKQDKVSQKLSL